MKLRKSQVHKGGVGSDGYERGLVWSNKGGGGQDFLNGRFGDKEAERTKDPVRNRS